MERTYRFAKRHRLTHALEFQAVYRGKVRESRGPLTVYAIPNELGHPRLGLSVGRKVGVAPKRNRIKRLIREAFRLMQHDWPRGFDVVVNVRPHDVAMLADYQRMMSGAMVKLVRKWGEGGTGRSDGATKGRSDEGGMRTGDEGAGAG